MAVLGLFPLPRVLVPTEVVPMHIYESRFRELLDLCIEQDEEFGVLLSEDGKTSDVGTRAAVSEVVEVFSDGRMHVIVEGGDRFRVLELHEDDPYPTGMVEELADEDDPPDETGIERVLEIFAQLQETVGSTRDLPDRNEPLLDWEIISRVDFGAAQKQELLEITSPRLRFARLAELLEHALGALSLEQEMHQRASGNGRVPSEHRE